MLFHFADTGQKAVFGICLLCPERQEALKFLLLSLVSSVYSHFDSHIFSSCLWYLSAWRNWIISTSLSFWQKLSTALFRKSLSFNSTSCNSLSFEHIFPWVISFSFLIRLFLLFPYLGGIVALLSRSDLFTDSIGHNLWKLRKLK